MNSTPTHLLFLILALLQLVAPLVHAHTGEESSAQGLHLPGYEHYNVNHDTPEFHALSHACAEEHSIISVGTGIKHKKNASDPASQYCLPIERFEPNLTIHSSLSPPHPLTQTPISAVHYFLLPSRAPPSQSIIVLFKD